jgi:uridylate kinase
MKHKERILIKLSGAALKGETNESIFSTPKLINIVNQIKILSKQYQIAVVIGGGNIWRGNMFDKNI